MSHRATRTSRLLWLVLGLAPIACRPLPDAHPHLHGSPTPVQDLQVTDEVPAAWGRLVAVTEIPGSSTLFFQDDSGAVRLVVFDRARRQLLPHVAVIRRQ